MVSLNDFRMAVGMPARGVEEAGEQSAASGFKLVDGGAAENVRMRQQLVQALSSDANVPKAYIEMIRQRLGLDTDSSDLVSGKPLSQREVVDIIEGADALENMVDIQEEMLVEKTKMLLEQDAKGLLLGSLSDEMAALQNELERLGEAVNGGVDATREKMVAVFAEAMKERAKAMMDEAVGMVVLSKPEDAAVVAAVVRDVFRCMSELRAMVREARVNPSFDFSAVKWPAPPSFDAWRKIHDERKAQNANAKEKADVRAARRRNTEANRERNVELRLIANMQALLAKLTAQRDAIAGVRKAPQAGSTLGVALDLYSETMETLSETRRFYERQAMDDKVEGFRKRLSERMGMAADNVTLKV